ncbi:MAG: outer membrane beta-barrel protein, partial [Bacteroidia bacterium]|nr:outer membrane beta-barrel protein [Bacteroidia bacterium]
YGIKAGANFSDLSVNSNLTSPALIKEVNAVKAWQAGCVVQYRLQDFAFQSELLYSVEGGDLLNPVLVGGPQSGPLNVLVPGTTVAYRSQNLKIPLNIQYGRDLGAIHLYALAGPYLSFLLSGTINGEANLWTKVQDKWGFNKVDLGFGIGGGAAWKNMQLTLRYDLGGTEIGKKATNNFVTTNLNPFFDMKERNLSVSLGYFF